MENHKIRFKDGCLVCDPSEWGDGVDADRTYEIYTEMVDYYNSMCTVRHWKQDTLESGRWLEAYVTIKSAMWQIKEGWFVNATITPETDDE